MVLAGLETGGTTCVAVLGTADGTVLAEREVPTSEPTATLDVLCALLREPPAGLAAPAAVGVAAFGPIDLRPGPDHGRLLATPKPGWSGLRLRDEVAARVGAPVAIDTDVNAAARAEGTWGAARGLADHAYVTIGTGIGVGIVVGGATVRGLVHPELGHMAVPREPGDDFPGICPFHGDCLEGLASGPALAARLGAPPRDLHGDDRDRARDLLAAYLARGLRTLVYAVAPRRVVLGGGVAGLPGLYDAVRARLAAELGGYPGLPEHADPAFVSPPGLAGRSGAVGALVLARDAAVAAGLRGAPEP